MSFRHFAAAEPKRPRGGLSGQGESKKPRSSPPAKDIFTACREGDVETVRKCLDEGVDVNEGNGPPDHFLPIELACTGGHIEVVRLLLSRPDISLNWTEDDYRKGSWLLNSLFDPDITNGVPRLNNCDILRLLLDAGAKVNTHMDYEGSLLTELAIYAIEHPHSLTNVYADMLRLCLSRPDIDVNRDGPMASALDAMFNNYNSSCYKVAAIFLEHPRIDVNQTAIGDDDYTPLHYAVWNRPFFRRILAYESLNPNLTGSSYHDTPLMYALHHAGVRTGRIVDLLNDARVDPNIPDNIGQTPLMYAVRKRKFAIVRHLLANVRVNLHQTMTLNASEIARYIRPKQSYEMYELVNEEIRKRRKKQQLELARVMHRKQIEEGKGHKREAPTDVMEHIGSFLDHEMKSKLHF